MKVALAPLFAIFALASAQNLNVIGLVIKSPLPNQEVKMGNKLVVQVSTNVCFVSLFVAYSLKDSN